MKDLLKPTTWLRTALLLLVFTTLACSISVNLKNPTPSPPTQTPGSLRAVFVGQDGGDYAGRLCSSGSTNDNAHIRLMGMRTDVKPVSYRLDEPAGGGVWASPCDPVSNWFLYAAQAKEGRTDLYFKPFRDAPVRSAYKITVTYSDGSTQSVVTQGLHVYPWD